MDGPLTVKNKTEILQVARALPQTLEFYHLGEVKLQHPHSMPDSGSEVDFQESSVIGFQIFGESKATILFFFAKDLDVSVYSELGNLLTSQIANQVSRENHIDVLISPPRRINIKQVEQMIQNHPPLLKRTYIHFCKNQRVPIITWLLPTPSEGFGYA